MKDEGDDINPEWSVVNTSLLYYMRLYLISQTLYRYSRHSWRLQSLDKLHLIQFKYPFQKNDTMTKLKLKKFTFLYQDVFWRLDTLDTLDFQEKFP